MRTTKNSANKRKSEHKQMNKIKSTVFFLMFLISITVPMSAAGQSPVEGNWVGGTNALGGWMLAQAAFSNVNNNLTGVFDVPSADASGLRLVNPTLTGSTVKFQIPTPLGLFGFEGELKDDLLSGTITNPAGAKAKLHLVRSAKLEPSVFDSLAGTYEAQNGLSLMVIPTSRGQLTAIRTETSSGQTILGQHILIPASAQKFFTAASVTASPAADETFTFDVTGGTKNLTWRKKDGSMISAVKKDSFKLEQVQFQNGGVKLSGVLISPLTKGPHPAAIIVPSSGPDTRSNTGIILRAEILLRSGVAALLYDKRGAGDSTGDWERATFKEQAEDALAGVAFLQKRKDINAKQIGLMGHSQSAWIVPIAASLSKKFSFAVITSGGGAPVADQEIYRAETQTRNAKFPEEDVAEAVNLMKLKWQYGMTGENWQSYEDAAKKAQAKKWFLNIGGTLQKDPEYWQFQRQLKGYEPLDYIKNFKLPVLILLGEADDTVPVKVDAVVWDKGLKEAGNKNFTITTLPKLGHTLLIYQQSGRSYVATEPGEIINKWLENRFKTRK